MRLGDPSDGTLTLQDQRPAHDWYVGDRDPDPTNDKAVITVRPDR
jgi:hypothetical protein